MGGMGRINREEGTGSGEEEEEAAVSLQSTWIHLKSYSTRKTCLVEIQHQHHTIHITTYTSPPQPSHPKMSSPKTIAFFGATGGCGLSLLKRSLSAGHTCIALCRTPSKLSAHFPSAPANLIIKAGNAHDLASVAACLTVPDSPNRLVDAVSFSIGGAPDLRHLSIDDPDVCKKGMKTLLEALKNLREEGKVGRPLLSVISTTGISKHGRDVPLAFIPLYHVLLKAPHEDKKVMEAAVFASGERFVVIRPSLLVDGEQPEKPVRVGVEDPESGWEKTEIGYTISREDVGRWIWEEVFEGEGFEGKAVTITW